MVQVLLNQLPLGHEEITEIVSGGAMGVDKEGEVFANQHKIPIKMFLPDWNIYGKKAGIIRNEQMADYCDIGVAIWDESSKGTKHMISALDMRNKSYYLTVVKPWVRVTHKLWEPITQ